MFSFLLQHARHNLYPRVAKHPDAPAANQWIGVQHAHNHTFGALLQNQFGARRRLAVMAARLQTHVQRSLVNLCLRDAAALRVLKTTNLGMRTSETLVPTLC